MIWFFYATIFVVTAEATRVCTPIYWSLVSVSRLTAACCGHVHGKNVFMEKQNGMLVSVNATLTS